MKSTVIEKTFEMHATFGLIINFILEITRLVLNWNNGSNLTFGLIFDYDSNWRR